MVCRYDEYSSYSYSYPGFSEATGHFTQVSATVQTHHVVRCTQQTYQHLHAGGTSVYHFDNKGGCLVTVLKQRSTRFLRVAADHGLAVVCAAAWRVVQVVWKSTTAVGCAVQACGSNFAGWSNGGVYVVCRCGYWLDLCPTPLPQQPAASQTHFF